jgi:GT2 family glycosyltransferase
VVNHSNPELLRDCLRSIYASVRRISVDVWVVDNATDGLLVAELRDEFPRVKWLFNEERLGFSANHNQVLRVADSRYVCILNDDTVIHDGALDILTQYMDEHPQAAIAGPRLLNTDGSIQNSAFRKLGVGYFVLKCFFLPRRLARLKGPWVHPGQGGTQPCQVAWLLGACLVVRREYLSQIGLLDSSLSPIANSEDIDWCVRCADQGFAVSYVPQATVTHLGGMSLWRAPRSGVDTARVELMRTLLAYIAKHNGWWSAALVRMILVISFPWNAAMLISSRLRRQVTFDQFRSEIQTLRRIALLGMFEPIGARLANASGGVGNGAAKETANETIVPQGLAP